MRKLLYFLPFQFTLFLILGICIQFYGQVWNFGFWYLASIHVFFLLIFLFLKHKKGATYITFIYFLFVGISTVFIQNDVNYQNYYKPFLKNNATVVLKIDKVLKSSKYQDKYVAIVVQVDHQKTRGTVLLNVEKDSLTNKLKVNEKIIAKPTLQQLNASLNPHQFDYHKYLEKEGIQEQLFLSKNAFKRLGFGTRTPKGWAEQFRDLAQTSFKKYPFQNQELAVMNALILGQRHDVSKQLLTDYSRAGAIHILAVSGLHVGIILMLLQIVFKPFDFFNHGKVVKTILIIGILWMFAFVAGLSASVVRAVTMFTFVAIGQQFGSKKIILFSLFSSLLVLLIFNPYFLFDVGFQLSYLAVLGIVILQQKVYQCFEIKVKIFDFFWKVTSVSIAAQIGVLPLSLYYFHQFPMLFFLSNMIIIPCLGILLSAGFLLLFLAIFNIYLPFLPTMYGNIIWLMNAFISWISKQEQFLFKEVSLSFALLLASYVLLFFGILFLFTITAKNLRYFLVSIVFFQGIILIEIHQKNQKKECIVFHKTKETLLGFRTKNHITFLHSTPNVPSIEAITNAYTIGENVRSSFVKLESNIYFFNKQPLVLIDSLGVYPTKNLKNPIVLLQNSPKINIERMIRILKPTQIIADGSNYKSYVLNWKNTCLKLRMPFYNTSKNGAIVIKN